VINLLLWMLTLAGLVALVGFAWRSAMRRRGIRLVEMLREEGVLHAGIDLPVQITRDGRRTHLLPRRGTVVLTKRRLAGFAHRSRFVFVRGRGLKRGAVGAEGEWLMIRPSGDAGGGPQVGFRIGDAAAEWARDAGRVLRLR
jgi:hypothetical protein